MSSLSRSARIPALGLVLALVLLAATYIVPDGADALVMWPCLLIFYLLFVDAIRKPTRIVPGIPTFVTIEVLFLIFSYLIFYMPYQLWLFGQFDLGVSVFLRNTFVVGSNKAIVMSTLGIVCFYVGIRPKPRAQSREEPRPSGERAFRNLPLITFVALLGLILLFQLAGWRSAGEGRYTGTTSGGVLAEGVSVLILMFSMIAVALAVVQAAKRERLTTAHWLALAPAVYWALRILMAGDRNSFFLIAIVGIGGLLTVRMKTGRLALVGLIVGGLAVYNVIEIVRSVPGAGFSEILSASSGRDEGDSSFNISTVGVRAAVVAVPQLFDFAYGKYTLIGIAGIVPLIRGLVIGESQTFLGSSDLLGNVMVGPYATWGVGSNIIADLYLDLGVLGVAVGMYLIGRFAGFVRNSLMEHPTDPGRLIYYLLTLALFAELPRYSTAFPVRILVWTYFLLGLIRLLSKSAASSASSGSVILSKGERS